MDVAEVQTVSEWRASGYRGLRIQQCRGCGGHTDCTWEQLSATHNEDVAEVAQRVRCRECGQASAGLAILTHREAASSTTGSVPSARLSTATERAGISARLLLIQAHSWRRPRRLISTAPCAS